MTAIKLSDFREGKTLPDNRIGCVVWWSADAIKIDPVELADRMAEHCLDHQDLVRSPVKPIPAMRRAMSRRQGAEMEKGWRWEEITEDKSGLLIALAESERDASAREYRAKTRLTVLVDSAGNLFWSRKPIANEIGAVESLVDRFTIERGFLTQADLRALLTEILLVRSKGVRLKDGGAVYFLPSPRDAVIDGLARAIAPSGVQLVRFPVAFGDQGSIGQILEAASKGIFADAKEVAEQAKVVLSQVQRKEKKVRISTIDERRKEAEEIRQKARLYREIMNLATDDIDLALADAETAMRLAIESITEASK